ncbi:MAG TPA: single-stranded-DNA-specific exonuclease RecJ [Caulobacteraceae bacterium]|nr:single-stranded-DNA-specific exonuclease RecJ [Caulobacteraceae bacterium]
MPLPAPSHSAPPDEHPPFLGVTRSLTGRRWRARSADPALIRAQQARLGLAEPLARALAARGVGLDEGQRFLAPTLRAYFPDPSSFADMDRAAGLLIDGVERQRRIVIFADYDVDGAASAALLARWLRAVGAEAQIYVPDRLTEGFGPTPVAFRRLKGEGADLVVTVDCGAAADAALAEAGAIGLPVVVIDHHLMRAMPAGVAALVNPNRPDCASGQGVLAAAGVTFVFLAALNREGRRRGLFTQRREPDLLAWLDLAALGAVCDVTALTGFNRALAAQGLKVMSAWANPGLAALMRIAGREGKPAGVFEAGFILGPRINAGGRVGRSDLGARLLATDDPAEAEAIAGELDALNAERRGIEARMVEAAIERIDRGANFSPADPALVVAEDGWHPGVVGIVAARLKERYRRPAIVIGVDRAADVGRGSGRSMPGVDLGAAIHAAFDAGLLLAGGGHRMAAGLTIRPAMVPELRAFLAERLADAVAEAAEAEAVEIDALIAPDAAAETERAFAALAPFGPANPEPLTALADVRLEQAQPMRGGHVRARLADGAGRGLEVIAWRSADTELGRRLGQGATLHVVGRLRADDWNGRRRVRLELEDVADPRRV